MRLSPVIALCLLAALAACGADGAPTAPSADPPPGIGLTGSARVGVNYSG